MGSGCAFDPAESAPDLGQPTYRPAVSGKAIPAPEVYAVLSSSKLLRADLDQALSQLSSGPARSLDEYDVYEDNGADPLVSAIEAVDLLTETRTHAVAMGDLLARAQVGINRQGYRDDEEDDGR